MCRLDSDSGKTVSPLEPIFGIKLKLKVSYPPTDLVVDFDITNSIGNRYRRQDEIGTPKCVTVDFGTIGEDAAQDEKDTVTIRDRDTQKQERMTIGDLIKRL